MKFGIFSHVAWPEGDTPKKAYDDKVEQVLAAEKWGFYSSWLAEHHFTRYGAISSLPQFLTYLAAKTDKIRLGTAVSVLPVHDPILLAEQFATLDVLSNGRLDVGIGRGFSPAEDAVFGIDREATSRLYLESVDVIRGLWTTPEFSFNGEFHHLDKVTLVPQPVQKPHPPLYMAAFQTSTNVEAAADRQLPIIVGIILDHDAAAGWFQEYQKMASARGLSPDVSGWPLQRPIFVAETEEEAREIPRKGVRWMWEMIDFISHNKHLSDIHQDFQGWRKNNPSKVSYEEFLEKKAIFGTPETVAAKIKWLRDTYNIQHLIGDFSAGALEQEQVLKSMGLFARKVMPELH
jgi:alkanesulfonate monooxygenase SsuD/methylene tetrahydromethanopterin reductase-like flavin-dependent oxidoreductase (luciferase family)